MGKHSKKYNFWQKADRERERMQMESKRWMFAGSFIALSTGGAFLTAPNTRVHADTYPQVKNFDGQTTTSNVVVLSNGSPSASSSVTAMSAKASAAPTMSQTASNATSTIDQAASNDTPVVNQAVSTVATSQTQPSANLVANSSTVTAEVATSASVQPSQASQSTPPLSSGAVGSYALASSAQSTQNISQAPASGANVSTAGNISENTMGATSIIHPVIKLKPVTMQPGKWLPEQNFDVIQYQDGQGKQTVLDKRNVQFVNRIETGQFNLSQLGDNVVEYLIAGKPNEEGVYQIKYLWGTYAGGASNELMAEINASSDGEAQGLVWATTTVTVQALVTAQITTVPMIMQPTETANLAGSNNAARMTQLSFGGWSTVSRIQHSGVVPENKSGYQHLTTKPKSKALLDKHIKLIIPKTASFKPMNPSVNGGWKQWISSVTALAVLVGAGWVFKLHAVEDDDFVIPMILI